MCGQIKQARGTALVEILIVVALSSLLIGLFLHADLAVNRSIMRWTFRSGLEQAAIRLGKQLRRDFDYCDSLRMNDTGELQVFRSNTPAVVYSTSDNTITRDGKILLPAKIVVSDFSLKPLNSKITSSSNVQMKNDRSEKVLTITLRRNDLATQTLMLPVRPYKTRHIE